MPMDRRAPAVKVLVALPLAAATACGGLLRAGPTIAPLVSARYLSVHLVMGDTADAQEKARLPTLRDSLAGALPAAWATATQGRGQLFMRNEGDIDVELAGTNGTSALTQHSRGGKVTTRTITVHTIDGNRRLTIPDLLSTTLHELGHIWCCYGPGTIGGHRSDPQPQGLASAGPILPIIPCQLSTRCDSVCPH